MILSFILYILIGCGVVTLERHNNGPIPLLIYPVCIILWPLFLLATIEV